MPSSLLYLVTHREEMELGRFFSIVSEAVSGGVSIVQLREKDASFDEFCDLGRQLLDTLKPRGVPLVINDRIDVAEAIGADGVHVGQSDASVAEARRVLGPNAMIGLSINCLEELNPVDGLSVDYVAASSVFASTVKTDGPPPLGLSRLREMCQRVSVPVIAIGGISCENIGQVMRCGASGVAVVSAIFNASCPRSAAKELINQMECV